MRVMDCAELLQYVEQRIDYYLENKPEHDNGFCWWLDSTAEDVILSISMMHRVGAAQTDGGLAQVEGAWADAYCVMAKLIQQYDSPELRCRSSYLSEEDGYNEQRANHLRNIRDTILIPRIEELS
jgi:hypothetical protein